MIATVLTLARNFGPWFAGVALIAFLAGSAAGFKGGRMWSADDVADAERAQHKAETTLTDFKASFAAATAEGERLAAERVAAATKTQAVRDARVEAAIASIPTRIAAQWRTDMTAFQESLHDPQYQCLDLPLPAPSLRLLERPGGRVAAPAR
jgi:hypothetical protein